MAITVPIPVWKQFYRVEKETAFGVSAATAEWPIGGNGGGANGKRDLAVTPGAVNLTPSVNNIFQQFSSGKRAMNQQAPVEGANSVEGTLEMPLYLELIDPIIQALMGTVVRTPTAGSAALASTAFASLATLDTQPDGTEVLKFVIASSTAASTAVINIIQNAVTVETITIGTSASSVDGDYYSKGAYDGSVNAITFTIAGTVTSGTVVVSGIDLVTNVFTVGTSAPPTLEIEEGGQPKSGSSSFFYNGVVISQLTFAFDRTALDGMVTCTATLASQLPVGATATTYLNDAKTFYHPLQGWTASIKKDGASFDKATAITFDIIANNNLFAVASGNQNPSGAFAGPIEVTGTITILPENSTEWDLFVGQTVGDYHITFTSPQDIVDSTKWSLLFEFSELFVENYVETVNEELFGADLTFRNTDDATDGVTKITAVSRMPV